MTAEKIYVRPDGTRVKIQAAFSTGSIARGSVWSIWVQTLQPRKKKWLDVFSTDDYHYRKLDFAAREAFILERQLAVCTRAEMLEVKLQIWESLKPTE